jgi:hypothetical protein
VPITTQPLLPDGEAPLDGAILQAFLRGMGTEMVLVGGQALAFWMDRYGIAPQGATISNDGDALGRLDQAERIARDLRALLVRPSDRALTALVAQIRIPIGTQGQVRNIDVLHLLFSVGGLRKSREFTDAVWRDSVEMEWQPGQRLRVMHPLHVLESRVHNAVGLLGDKGPHVLTQARWAIEVARAAMLRVLAQPSEQERLGVMLQQVYRLARSRAGRQLMREHGIETLLAVPVKQIRAGAPEHERQLVGVEWAIAARARVRGDR